MAAALEYISGSRQSQRPGVSCTMRSCGMRDQMRLLEPNMVRMQILTSKLGAAGRGEKDDGSCELRRDGGLSVYLQACRCR